MQTSPGRPGTLRRAGGLLWQRDFRLLWTGETISGAGSAMAAFGVPLLAVQVLRASTFAVSALYAAAYVPWLVIGLPAGAWVDRLPARRLMIVCDVLSAALFATLPVAAWLGVLTTGQLLAVALLAGGASVLFSTAYQVYLPVLLAPADMLEGNAKLQGSAQVASLSGRALAGLAAQAVGDATALLFNAASFLVSAACLLAIRGPAATRTRAGEQPEREPAAGEPAAGERAAGERAPGEEAPGEPAPGVPSGRRGTSVRAEVAAGLRFIAADRLMRRITVYAALVNLAYSGVNAITVVFLVRVVSLSPAAAGLLMAASSVGGIAGALAVRPVARRLGTARTLLLSEVVAQCFVLLIPLTGAGPRVAWYIAGAGPVSAGIVAGNIIVASFRQTYCPPRMLGRIIACQRFVGFGTVPLGGLLGGGLATALGVRTALWILCAGYVLAGAVLLTSGIARRRDLP
jgi:hypothetical protein